MTFQLVNNQLVILPLSDFQVSNFVTNWSCPAESASIPKLNFRFIKRAESKISEITYHHYSLNGHKAKFNDFLNPDSFKIFEENVKTWVTSVRNLTDLRVNLGETAVAYGGGEAGLTDRFVGSFMWANKLGLAATYGIKSVMREAVVSSNYRLIGSDLIPNPDYWITLSFKRLIYKKVLKTQMETNSEYLKVYASTQINNKRKWLLWAR